MASSTTSSNSGRDTGSSRANASRSSGGKVKSESATGAYWKFGVVFHDAPELTVESLFGEFNDEPPGEPAAAPKPFVDKPKKTEQADTPEPDDDIPF
jgi:hypothetical protein